MKLKHEIKIQDLLWDSETSPLFPPALLQQLQENHKPNASEN